MKATIEGWVARDKYGGINYYDEKPNRGEDFWFAPHETMLLYDSLFPSVKWEDSEPTKCKLTIEI